MEPSVEDIRRALVTLGQQEKQIIAKDAMRSLEPFERYQLVNEEAGLRSREQLDFRIKVFAIFAATIIIIACII